MSGTRIIGMIAGNGAYPRVFQQAAHRADPSIRLVVAAFENETVPDLESSVHAWQWHRVGQLGKLIKFFKSHGVTEAVMVGQIAPKNLFDLRPDLRTLVMLAKLKQRNAESLFGGIANELAKDGITLLPATTFLEDCLASEGHLFGPSLKKRQLDDAAYGFRIAKESSRLDIGQSVVVRHGTVLAVEAFEGTDACIKRGGELARKQDAILAKVAKPNHDFRFDVPVIGPRTIESCAQSGVHVIAVEAGCTLFLEKEKVAQLCDQHRISILGLPSITA